MGYQDDLDQFNLDQLEAEADKRIEEFRDEVKRKRDETTDPDKIAALGDKLGEAEALHEESIEMIENERRRRDIAKLLREIDESDIDRPDIWREVDELAESDEEVEEIVEEAGGTLVYESEGPSIR